MEKPKLSMLSRVLLVLAAVLFFCSLMFPMWQIDLDAPQYPEGLVLKLHANKIGGDVEIINGLNHYIGMKTLHTENFIEFKIIPYLMIAFGLACLLTAFVGGRKSTTALLVAFVLFVAVAGIDFYRWNYDYGHDLDPNAAIQVPGMAYQPPLIGYKQLLNFGAYSMPDVGGWMLAGAGLLLFMVVAIDRNWFARFRKNKATAAVLLLSLSLMSCGNNEPKPIKINSDLCDYCKMTISNGKFAAETITSKGRYYKFDDLTCMVRYVAENNSVEYSAYYVGDYLQENSLIAVTSASFIKGGTIQSPMRGNIAAFSSAAEAQTHAQSLGAAPVSWEELKKQD